MAGLPLESLHARSCFHAGGECRGAQRQRTVWNTTRERGLNFWALRRGWIATCAANIETTIREAQGQSEFNAAAKLRAEAYFEGDRSRFVSSLKRQFAEREAGALLTRTLPGPSGQPEMLCLVATDESGRILGTLDISICCKISGIRPKPVPVEDEDGCFITNVTVDEAFRRQGIANSLMQEANRLAVDWGASNLYTHVFADNDAACELYFNNGYKVAETIDALDARVNLGRKLLLKCPVLSNEENSTWDA
ncbi:hypothetical protein BSKO_02156 [Bryopsis sp. KO-2023]|nr:hypothetical protein BSKO_02156 [Bryopsis sp. KO-2023]